MFDKSDTKFAEMAAIPDQRRQMIASRKQVRGVLFWCAVVLTVLDGVSAFAGHSFTPVLSVGSVFQWMMLFYFDSDVRLLMVIDRISNQERPEKSA